MKIKELSVEELRQFVNYIPDAMLRRIFTLHKGESAVKGFRADKIPIDILKSRFPKDVKNSTNISEKVQAYFDNEVQNDVEIKKEKLVNDGFDKEMSELLSIFEIIRPECRKLYLKITDHNESEIEQLTNRLAAMDAVSEIVKLNLEKNKTENPIIKQDNNIEKEIVEIKKRIKEITKIDFRQLLNSKDKELIVNKIESIENSVKIIEKKAENEKTIESLTESVNKLKKELREKEKQYSVNTERLEKQIASIRSDILNISSERVQKGFEIEEVKNDKFDKDGIENLEACIFDVSSDSFTNTTYTYFESYLKEVILSNKPVFTNKKHSLFLTETIANIISGGNYYVATLRNDYNESCFISLIRELTKNKEKNVVILVKNLINLFDYDNIFHEIKRIGIRIKVVFEIRNDIEVRFLDDSIIDEAFFFSGCYEYHETEFRYQIKLEEAERKEDKKYKRAVEKINDRVKDFCLCGNNGEGILLYSIIPFTLFSQDLVFDDLINLIDDDVFRRICKEAIKHE